jgi:hypothetical protein
MNACILIDTKTRSKLKDLGKKGQTYDSIINELIQQRSPKNG